MTIEEQVREALQRAGNERRVDVPALQASTKAVLEKPRGLASRWDRWAPVVLAATAAATVIGAVVLVPGIGGNDSDGGVSVSPDGGVDDTFTCPVHPEARFDRSRDDSFLPELTDGLKPGGEAAGAPRWESEQVGSGAVLRLGNEDGSLASRVTFEETSKGFRPVRITKCTNDGAGATAPLKLITEGLPGSPDALTPDDFEPGAIPVMDRMTYDVRGLAKRQTLWAGPCGMRICLVAGVKTAFTRGTLKGDSPKPVDDSNQLANPDDAEGQDLGLRLIVVYDRADTLAAVSWDSFDGAINWVDPVAGGGWQGQLFLFMARDADLAVVTLHPNEGEGRNYHRDEFIE